jgi:hypothetical protein
MTKFFVLIYGRDFLSRYLSNNIIGILFIIFIIIFCIIIGVMQNIIRFIRGRKMRNPADLSIIINNFIKK